MFGFLVRRLINYIVLCVVATFLSFTLSSISFDPLSLLRQHNPPPPAATLEAKRVELHLDQPIPVRFLTWGEGVLHGDFGETTKDHAITDELWRRVGVSLRLFLLGITIGILLGVLIGVASAVRQYKFFDYISTFFSYVILATPVLVLGPLVKQVAQAINNATGSEWLQFTGEYSGTLDADAGWLAAFDERLRFLIVPTVTIVLGQIAYYSRYQRSAMLDVLGQDFVRTAQAKGLRRRTALMKHALRTALIPAVTYFAFNFGILIVGATFTEKIFGWHGMGEWLVDSVTRNDINAVAAVTCFAAVMILLAGLAADIAYAILDPRIRVS